MILPGPDSRAQSSVLGAALMLGLIVTAVGIAGMVGAAALNDTQQQVGVERSINTMTLFDSRAALVALGDADAQTVSFADGDGNYEVRPDAGWLRITHFNYSEENQTETVYNASLGALVHTAGDTEIAYQGGGVWRRGPDGGSLMLSPPEFHYRSATLTLPIVRLTDPGSSGGGSTAVVKPVERARHVYPNASAPGDGADEVGAPYDPNGNGSELAYENPIRNGSVNITVQSRYYEGWARYFQQRTSGKVTVFDDNQSVRLTLETVGGSIGDFAMPMDGNALSIRGMGDGHPIYSWDMTLTPDPHFQNLHWSMYADEGGQHFEAHIHSDSQCSAGSYDGSLDMSIYYHATTGTDTIHEEWQRQGIDPDTNPDFDVNCSSGELKMDLQGASNLSYGDIDMTGDSNKWHYGPEIKAIDITGPTTSFGIHPADTGNYSINENESLEFIIDHYVSLLPPSHDLVVTDGPGGSSRVDEGTSYGTFSFATTESAKYLTYLHITENEILVELE